MMCWSPSKPRTRTWTAIPTTKSPCWPLAAWISHDDARTWTEKQIISDYPACFCYPDGIVENSHLIFAIETNRREILFVDYPV